MSADLRLTRRAFASGLALTVLSSGAARAQGYAGLGRNAAGFAAVTPGKTFRFPDDHGPHPDFRIEWWYLTANLTDTAGTPSGLQWTLFRQAMRPGPQQQGWDSQQFWMAHAAVTRADLHRVAEKFARGGIGQAGVEARPFEAWIDAWRMRGTDATDDRRLSPLTLNADGPDFGYALTLTADRAVVLQGDSGYSRKSERGGQASYYYSQPFYAVTGRVTLDGRAADVTGQAWMDREWSSQPLAADQSGWDWFAMHLGSGEKLMLYRMRETNGPAYTSGTWITRDGGTTQLASGDVEMAPSAMTAIGERKLPTSWRIAIPRQGLAIETSPINPNSWMGTSFPYWEGPIRFSGSHAGVGYLELTGY